MPHWSRFDAGPGQPLRADAVAEQLEDPRGGAAHHLLEQHLAEPAPSTRRGGAPAATGDGSPTWASSRTVRLPGRGDDATATSSRKLALQYIENHDHERFVCNFGT